MTKLYFDWLPPMIEDIKAAKSSIRITALSMQVPLSKKTSGIAAFFMALQDAAARGVDIKICLPAPTRQHGATAYNASTAERLKDHKIRWMHVPSVRLLHQKTCIIDQSISWVGSGNFTQAAGLHNYEAYIRTDDVQIAHQLWNRFVEIGGF